MHNLRLFAFGLVFMALAPVLMAQTDSVQTADQNKKGQAAGVVSYEEVQRIAAKVMAPCCWAETANVHQSPAAAEVKAYIRSGLAKGWSEQKILDGLVARYGERILAEPRAKGFNLMAWILPVVAFLFAGWGLVAYLRKSRGIAGEEPAHRDEPKAESEDPDSYAARVERELEELD